MPLSKVRMRERKRRDRMSNLTDTAVKPKYTKHTTILGEEFRSVSKTSQLSKAK